MSAAKDAIKPDCSGFVAADGRQIYWEYFGAGKREVVCLFNGLAMNTESWYRLLPYLLDEHDVLLYDYLGQGKSSAEDEPYSIPRFCDHLVRILDSLQIPRIHGLGLSYGGFVALDFARLYQDRLVTLTLSGILLSHEEQFQHYQNLSLRFYRSGAVGFELYTYYMYEKIFGEAFLKSAKPYLEKMRQSFYHNYRDRVYCLVRLTEAQNPFFAALGHNLAGYQAIQTPALILAGAEDRVILPKVQQKISSILPNASFEVIEDSGHVVHVEQPERFFGRFKGFMQQPRRETLAPPY